MNMFVEDKAKHCLFVLKCCYLLITINLPPFVHYFKCKVERHFQSVSTIHPPVQRSIIHKVNNKSRWLPWLFKRVAALLVMHYVKSSTSCVGTMPRGFKVTWIISGDREQLIPMSSPPIKTGGRKWLGKSLEFHCTMFMYSGHEHVFILTALYTGSNLGNKGVELLLCTAPPNLTGHT